MLVTTIHFPETCLEAIEFYKTVFGAKVLEINYRTDAPDGSEYRETGEKGRLVMHAELDIYGTRINMADVEGAKPGNMFLFNVFLPTADEVTKVFNQLSVGGTVTIELKPEFWAAMYGEVIDRFGIKWQLMTSR